MARYDVYRKRNWETAKFKKASIRNDVSVLTHDTINLCNTLYDIAEGLNNLKSILNNPEINSVTNNAAENTQAIAKIVSKLGSDSINHIGSSAKMIASKDDIFSTYSRNVSDRMVDSARALERI